MIYDEPFSNLLVAKVKLFLCSSGLYVAFYIFLSVAVEGSSFYPRSLYRRLWNACVCTSVYVWVYVCVHMCTSVCVCMCAYVYLCVYVCVLSDMCPCIFISKLFIRLYRFDYTCISWCSWTWSGAPQEDPSPTGSVRHKENKGCRTTCLLLDIRHKDYKRPKTLLNVFKSPITVSQN